MTEIKGYLLTEKEEKACLDLVKKLREQRFFIVDFSGCVKIKAKTQEEASNIFWKWVGGDLQDKSPIDWYKITSSEPY